MEGHNSWKRESSIPDEVNCGHDEVVVAVAAGQHQMTAQLHPRVRLLAAPPQQPQIVAHRLALVERCRDTQQSSEFFLKKNLVDYYNWFICVVRVVPKL